MNNLKFKLMTKKNLFLVALAAVAFAACSDDFADAPPVVTPTPENYEIPIVFNSASNSLTRAEYTGAVAADMLGRQFVVSGYKGTKSDWATSTNPKKVFDNFLVVWQENTAHTTESNSSNWEYAGKGPIAHAKTNGVTQQAIKYWDYDYDQYDFIAWSTGTKTPIYTGTPGDGEVLVSSITPATAAGTSGTTAFTMQGKAADLSQCYIADLVTVKKDDYQKTVKLTFRSLGTKVRIGIYETIPGYSVKNVEFYSAAASNDADASEAKLFTTSSNNIYTEGTYTIYYPTVDSPSNADNNQAHIAFAPSGTSQSSTVSWGNLKYTIKEDAEPTAGNVFLGRSSNKATFAGDPDNNYYVYYLPNESGTNLNLRVNYTLEAIDGTGENITVKGATAQVPSIYAQWKPGYAYTYIFKISDKTNGFTGPYDPTQPDNITVNSTPAGLYPITFDAVVVNSEDAGNTQETITTVSTPSITTYQNGSNVVNNDEYTYIAPVAGKNTGEIYVTVNDGNAATTPDLANGALQTLTGKVALYSIPAGKTEADVVDALQKQDDDIPTGITILGRNKLPLSEQTLTLTDVVKYGVDGNEITLSTNQAAKFTPTAQTTYAFVYTKTASTTANDEVKYQPVAFSDANVKTKYRYAFLDPTGDVQEGETYYQFTAVADLSTYSVKQVFLGQRVDNLYTRSGSAGSYTYTQASGYAKTGTIYYYTLDGVTFNPADVIAYANFAGTTLYTDPNGRNVKGAETTPIDGVAYYQSTSGVYNYCVIYPEQANTLKQIDTDKAHCIVITETAAIPGMTYFDKYIINDGVYYAKIIKVQ